MFRQFTYLDFFMHYLFGGSLGASGGGGVPGHVSRQSQVYFQGRYVETTVFCLPRVFPLSVFSG